MAALFALSLWLSNAAYCLLSVSFVQMLKVRTCASTGGACQSTTGTGCIASSRAFMAHVCLQRQLLFLASQGRTF